MVEAIDAGPLLKFQRVLAEQGILSALRVLNARAPHRYTGIYRYTPETLRNVYLVDAFDITVEHGSDVAHEDAYCMLLSQFDEVAFGTADQAPCPPKSASPVVSYCGVLLRTASGAPFGSLCHFDVARCQRPAQEMPTLVAAAPLLMAVLERQNFGQTG